MAEAVNQNMAVFFSAVMQYGGNFLAVDVFSFSDGDDFGGSGKPQYGGIFSAVIQYGGNCLSVMQYGGNFLAVSSFSFFGGNVIVSLKLGQLRCLASYMHTSMFLAPEQTANLFPTITLVHTL